MKTLTSLWQWICNKCGRLAAGVAVALGSIDVFDISMIKEPITRIWGDKAFYYGVLICAGLSWLRHQIVANRHPKNPPLPPPDPSATRSLDAAKILLAFILVAAVTSTCIAVATEPPVEVSIDPHAPKLVDGPLTAVVVTQCNLIVAVYMTMKDGRLLRYDKDNGLPSEELMSLAYAATRSERVEVSCKDTGAVGYEKHEPV